MWAKYLLILYILELCFGQSLIPVYDVHINDLLRMQQGSGWPQHVRVVKGNEALMRLTSTTGTVQNCLVTTPTGTQFNVNSPPNNRFEQWGEGCGLRVKSVEENDHGRWRLVADGTHTGWSEVHIEADTLSYTPEDPISLPDGKTEAEVELTTLENSYCLVTQPFSESSLVPGHCRVTLDRTTRAVQGRWNVILGLPGRVSELQVERNIAVQTEQLVSGYREDSTKLHLYCNILYTEKNITFCRFQRNSESVGFNIRDGLSDGRYSYYGEGFARRHCGMTIEVPTVQDYGVWRCTVGLQEWHGDVIQQSSPMQALFRAAPRQHNAIIRNKPETREDTEIRKIFVEVDTALTIICRADSSLAYCWFQHPNGTSFSPVQRVGSEERDFWYTGDSLQLGYCGITFAHVTDEDNGEWTCHMGASDALGLEDTDKVEVRVTGSIAATHQEIGVVVGEEATLYCHTSNGPRPLDYCRFLTPNSVGINIDSSVTADNAILNRFYFTPERDLEHGDCSLTISAVQEEDIGNWTCAGLVHDGREEGKDSITVHHIVDDPASQRPLSTITIIGLVGMAIAVVALGTIVAGFVWYKNGKPIPWRRMTFGSARTDQVTIEITPTTTPRMSGVSDSSNEDSPPQLPVTSSTIHHSTINQQNF